MSKALIEKVARAICESNGIIADAKLHTTVLSWEAYVDEAQAAIQAIRNHEGEVDAGAIKEIILSECVGVSAQDAGNAAYEITKRLRTPANQQDVKELIKQAFFEGCSSGRFPNADDNEAFQHLWDVSDAKTYCTPTNQQDAKEPFDCGNTYCRLCHP